MIILLFVTILLLSGCAGAGGTTAKDETKPSFKMVSVPVALNSEQARAEYMADHYWDNFDFGDTTLISMPELAEQAFSNYIAIIQNINTQRIEQSINKLLSHAQSDSTMFAYFTELSERYLYDPNSPLRDEELYIPVLRFIIASPKVDEVMKIRPRELLDMALKNRPGHKANNFGYTTIKGTRGDLYSIGSNYTLIFFNNPGCHACKEISEQILASQTISRMLADRSLSILALYPDLDLVEWHKYAANIPGDWINAHDKSRKITDDQLYDLKAIPTLYLLDKDKTVLLKDANFGSVEQLLDFRTDNRHQNSK